MLTIYIAMGAGLGVARRRNGGWQTELALADQPTQCLVADPDRPERVYCGTFGRGLWWSDGGTAWQPVGEGIGHAEVMAVAVSRLERPGKYGVIWAGTEPSTLFRSEDGGQSWQERPGLDRLPSAPTWSFPPRPWTHHVRTIAPDATVAGRLFVGIELGGVMRSLDGGRTWEDRKPGSQPDAHALATHPLAPGRIYEAAGGGYAGSRDGGTTWSGEMAGLAHRYVWGLAVDPADPDTLVVSAAHSAAQAHYRQSAEAVLYRRAGGEAWQLIRAGLPEPKGTRAYALAAHVAEPGVFYAAADAGRVYRSADAGQHWEQLDIAWPGGYPGDKHVQALLVTETE